MLVGVLMETWGISLACSQVKSLVGTGGERKLYFCLVLFVIFMGFGGAKRWERGRF